MPLDIQPVAQVGPRSFHSPSSINGLAGLGEAGQSCSIWGPAFAGALALYIVPPLLAGFFSGVKQGAAEGWADRAKFRGKRR